jgi:hypothetical protein
MGTTANARVSAYHAPNWGMLRTRLTYVRWVHREDTGNSVWLPVLTGWGACIGTQHRYTGTVQQGATHTVMEYVVRYHPAWQAGGHVQTPDGVYPLRAVADPWGTQRWCRLTLEATCVAP